MIPRRLLFILSFVSFSCMTAFCAEANPLRNLEIGAAGFPFSLSDMKGNAVTLDKYKGKPVVICYWRRGQPYSEKMLSVLAKEHSRFAAKGVEFLAIAGKDEEEAGSYKNPEIPFPMLLDDKREVYGSYGLFILPTTFILNKEHRLAAYFASYQDGVDSEIEDALSKVLGIKEAPKAPPRYGKAEGSEDPELNFARKLLEDGRPEEALPLLEEGLKKSPGFELKLLSGQALFELNRLEEARVRVEDCLKESPASRPAMLLLGRTLTLLGRYEPAEELLKKTLLSNPYPGKAHYYLGDLYEKTGRKDLALAEYRLALEGVFRR